MVYLYTCMRCELGDHDRCEKGHPAPTGVYGGTRCRCFCNKGGGIKVAPPDIIPDEVKAAVNTERRRIGVWLDNIANQLRSIGHCQPNRGEVIVDIQEKAKKLIDGEA